MTSVFKLRKNMLISVAQNNTFCTNDRVVSCRLFKRFLGEFYVGSFAFNQNFWERFFGHQKVDSFGKSIQFDLFF